MKRILIECRALAVVALISLLLNAYLLFVR